MKSILLIIGLLISTIVFCQKTYKPSIQKSESCVIIKNQSIDIQNIKFENLPSGKKDNSTKNVATIGLIGFGAIMSANYWTGSDSNLKTEKVGYWGLMGTLAASIIVVRIAL